MDIFPSDTTKVFMVSQTFWAYIVTQSFTFIKVLRANNSCEYTSHEFQTFYNKEVLYLNDHVLILLHRMRWQSVKAITCWIWLECYA